MPDWAVREVYETEIDVCDHESTKATRYTKSNGVVCVYLQCLTCGIKVREAPKRNYDLESLPWFDETYRQHCEDERRRALHAVRTKWIEERDQELEYQDAEWWERYNAYLESPHWKRLRRQVLLRDNFTCQGCFIRVTDATAEGHHLSYTGFNRVGKSYGYEIVTLCKGCHQEYHDK